LTVVLLCALRAEDLAVMGCRWRLRLADEYLASNQVDMYRSSLDEAMGADPWSSQAAERLAGLRLEDFERLPTAQQLRSFKEADAQALALAPRRSGVWEKSGQSHAAIHQRTGDVEQLDAAATAFQKAIELYPSNAEPRARLAVLLAAAERGDEARAAALEAIVLDDQMRAAGHVQQLLEPALRVEVDAIAGQSKQ
jgi:Flp pilus assembly protein TadD